MNTITKVILGIVLGILLVSLGTNGILFVKYRNCKNTIVEIDTTSVLIIDTLTVPKDSIVEKTRYIDSLVMVPVDSTVLVNDTLYTFIQLKQHHFGSKEADIWVKGYKVSLDSLKVYPKTRVETVTVTKFIPQPKKRFTVTVGPSVGFYTKGIDYGASLTVGYRLFDF